MRACASRFDSAGWRRLETDGRARGGLLGGSPRSHEARDCFVAATIAALPPELLEQNPRRVLDPPGGSIWPPLGGSVWLTLPGSAWATSGGSASPTPVAQYPAPLTAPVQRHPRLPGGEEHRDAGDGASLVSVAKVGRFPTIRPADAPFTTS
jgi:hypothetical protein